METACALSEENLEWKPKVSREASRTRRGARKLSWHLLKFFEVGKHLEPRTRFLISVVTKVIGFSPRGLSGT
jgi:hypothetical protein